MGPTGERHPTSAAGPPFGVVIRHATDEDAVAVSALHAGQIAEGFLSVLGPSFLRRLYRRIARTPGSFLLVAESEGTVVGFIAGSADVARLYRTFLVRDGLVAGASAAKALLTGWRRALDTLGHASSKSAGVGRGTELLAIAVDADRQRRGTGALLVDAFLGELGTRGATAAHVVVGADNAPAIALYGRAGFVTAERFELHAGTESLLMQWDRGESPPPPRSER
jgi:ribosomal protein S18 acetylase RimI-like enzyme